MPKPPLNILAVDKVGSKLIWFAPDGSTQRTLRMPTSPHEMVLSSDGEVGYVSIYGSGTYQSNLEPGTEIQVVNLHSGKRLAPISISPYSGPHGLTFDQDGLLWVTCDALGVVLAVSVERRKIVDAIETGSRGTHWIIASPDGRWMYTSNKQDQFLSVLNSKERRVETRIEIPHGAEGICLSPDGRWLYAADHRRAVVLKIDTQLDRVVEEITLTGISVEASRTSHHTRVRVSPDGGLLAVAVYHHDRLFLVDTSHTDRQTMVKTGAGPMAMAFHPLESALLYLSNHDEGTVSIVGVRAGEIVKTFPCGSGIESMESIGHR
jgi:DNA-binding beta-propeller fold protein YncE